MRFTPILFLLLIISCKKDQVLTNTSSKDSIIQPHQPVKDSVKLAIYKYGTELCSNVAQYDSKLYTKKQLDGVYKIWYQLSGSLLSTESVFTLKDLNKVRAEKDMILRKLDLDYEEKKEEISQIEVVDTEYWKDTKKFLLKSLDAEYEWEKTKIIAFSEPSAVINSKFSKDCNHFALALNTDQETMIVEWKKLRENMSKQNADPERIMNQFREQLNTNQMKDYAFIDLITFGWGNCANKNVPRLVHDEAMNKEFEALFIKINSECDEP